MKINSLRFVLVNIVCVLVINSAYAQSQKNKELLSLLKSIPDNQELSLEVEARKPEPSSGAQASKQGSNIVAYTLNSNVKISDVSLINNTVSVQSTGSSIANKDGWSTVIFTRPSVPVWVSTQYVKQTEGIATITANILNGRLNPSANSEKITAFKFGFSGQVLSARNGFVQLYAPITTPFLVKDSQLKKLPSDRLLNSQFSNNNLTISPAKQQVIKEKVSDTQISLNSEPLNKTVKSSDKDAESSHILAPGDSISLFVFGETDLSRDNIRIPDNGRISLPLIGEVMVSGKTTSQVESQVKIILASGYVNDPQLSVSIFSYRPIFIRGAVQNTGAFPYSQGLSIAKALALAGGALNSAKPQGVSVSRDGNVVKIGLNLDSQYTISSGDVISIDEEQGVRDDENLFIYLHGEVAHPGEYRYRKGLTVEKAIVLAGGFTIRASRKKVSITRYADVEENQEPTKLKKVKLYKTIMPGDVINVRATLF